MVRKRKSDRSRDLPARDGDYSWMWGLTALILFVVLLMTTSATGWNLSQRIERLEVDNQLQQKMLQRLKDEAAKK